MADDSVCEDKKGRFSLSFASLKRSKPKKPDVSANNSDGGDIVDMAASPEVMRRDRKSIAGGCDSDDSDDDGDADGDVLMCGAADAHVGKVSSQSRLSLRKQCSAANPSFVQHILSYNGVVLQSMCF